MSTLSFTLKRQPLLKGMNVNRVQLMQEEGNEDGYNHE